MTSGTALVGQDGADEAACVGGPRGGAAISEPRAHAEAAAPDPLPASTWARLACVLAPETLQQVESALASGRGQRTLRVAELQVGAWGVLVATVRQVHPTKPYNRKNGGTGLLGKVTLGDESGEVVLTLWDDETRHVQEGTFTPGAVVRLQGPTVKEGWRAGVELGLGAAVITRLAPMERRESLTGAFLGLAATRVEGAPPHERFLADASIETPAGTAHLVAEGDLVRQLRGLLPGTPVRVTDALPHPVLEGWWLGSPPARVNRV
jgi:hypothetical protein